MRAGFRAIKCRGFGGVAGAGVGSLPLSPAVWHLIENNQLDPSSIKGTGKGGRLLKGDVLAAIDNKSAQKRTAPAKKPSTPSPSVSSTTTPLRRFRPHQDIPLTETRKEAAHRFGESKASVPHSYARISCSLENVHATLKALQGKSKVELSVSDFVIAAAARALRKVPAVNSICSQGEPQQLEAVDICLALPTSSGLMTPVLENADTMGLAKIAQTVAALKANPNNQGGSFTIYDLQAAGLSSFTAVINPPQAAILAVSTTADQLNATLSLDVRVGDDLLAAQWLVAFQGALENLAL